jgi:hypothetical protein
MTEYKLSSAGSHVPQDGMKKWDEVSAQKANSADSYNSYSCSPAGDGMAGIILYAWMPVGCPSLGTVCNDDFSHFLPCPPKKSYPSSTHKQKPSPPRRPSPPSWLYVTTPSSLSPASALRPRFWSSGCYFRPLLGKQSCNQVSTLACYYIMVAKSGPKPSPMLKSIFGRHGPRDKGMGRVYCVDLVPIHFFPSPYVSIVPAQMRDIVK